MLKTIALVVALGTLAQAQAKPPASSREQIQRYIEQLQGNPNDDALRTKIIELALTLHPKPTTPAPALEAEGKGKYLADHAVSVADLTAAAGAFAKASLLAPWVPDYYFNQGVLLEKAEGYQDAIKAFQWYRTAAPDAKDSSDVLVRIGGLQAAIEKATQQAAAQAEAERQRAAAAAEAERQRRESPQVTGYWIDPATGLMWIYGSLGKTAGGELRDPYGPMPSWNDAVKFCTNLTLGGFSDWRLPELGELEAIRDPTESPCSRKGGLKCISQRDWSATTYGSSEAWAFNFTEAAIHGHRDRHLGADAHCVRRP